MAIDVIYHVKWSVWKFFPLQLLDDTGPCIFGKRRGELKVLMANAEPGPDTKVVDICNLMPLALLLFFRGFFMIKFRTPSRQAFAVFFAHLRRLKQNSSNMEKSAKTDIVQENDLHRCQGADLTSICDSGLCDLLGRYDPT